MEDFEVLFKELLCLDLSIGNDDDDDLCIRTSLPLSLAQAVFSSSSFLTFLLQESRRSN